MKAYRAFQAISAAILIAGMAAAIFLCVNLLRREQDALKVTTKAEAQHVSTRLENSIIENFEPLNQLAAWWRTQGPPLIKEDWESDAQIFLSRSPGLMRAAWVGTDGFERWRARPGAAPEMKRVPVDEVVAACIAQARSSGTVSLSPISESPEGPLVYVCLPVKDRNRGGYMVGLYNVDTLLAPLVTAELRPGDSLWLRAGERVVYSTGPGKSSVAMTRGEADLRVADQVWILGLGVSWSYAREFRGAIGTVAGVIATLAYSWAMLIYLSQRRSSRLEQANVALRKEMERRIRSEEEARSLNRDLHRKVADFETLLEVIPIGIAVAEDPECRKIRVNPALARMMGVPKDLNISKSGPAAENLPYRILRNGIEVRADELAMQVAASTRTAVMADENQIVRSDGTTVDILNFASPVFDENGNVRGVLNACVDMTESKAREQVRRELEQRLERAERRKSLGVMAAGIAHDFNNLLTSIIGQASLATEYLPEDHQARQHVGLSLDAAERAAALVHQVLAYTGRAHHRLKETHLRQVMEELRPVLAKLAEGTTEMRLHLPEALPTVVADASEIRDMLQHLVRNAIEAIVPEQKRQADLIEITVDTCELTGDEQEMVMHEGRCAPGSYVRIEVRDLAGGMPAEIAERAFDPFFSTKFVGRGMGLSEVLGIMRAHHGAVRLRSVLNMGTSVELFFPALEQRGRTKGGITEPHKLGASGSSYL